MDNNSQPNVAGLPPAVDDNKEQAPQEAAQPQAQQQPSQTGVELDSPILMPTHFDAYQTQQGVPTIVPEGDGTTAPAETTEITTDELTKYKKKAKTYMVMSVVFGIFALVGVVLSVVALLDGNATKEKLNDANDELDAKTAIISKVEEKTGAKIENAESVPEYKPLLGWIYITQWGVKLKIPNDLTNLSYIVNANDFDRTQTVCFNATKKGVKYFPEFANVSLNGGGMGCLVRVASYEGDIDKDTGISFGTKVFSYGDYSFFYRAPGASFSSDEANAGLESVATQILKNMISTNIEHYE